MYVTSLSIENYRNLKSFTFFPSEGVNVIYGDNAQGKTNLAESLWLFCGQKSFRGAKDRDLIAFGKDQAKLSATVFAEKRKQTGNIIIESNRKVIWNGVSLSSPSELSRRFCAVVFSPEHLSFVKDGPAVRRNFLDSAIAQIRPKYTTLMNGYLRAVKQRNVLLKDRFHHREWWNLAAAYEYHIARFGAAIIAQRKRYIEALQEEVSLIFDGLSGGKESLTISYKMSTEGESEEKLIAALEESRSKDEQLGFTSVGPHRDDLELMIDGFSCRMFGSQGQQRSTVISLKLAEAAILKRQFQEQPIAILDDVMSELDAARQDYILNHMEGWQVFITCCDPAAVLRLSSGAAFEMKDGMLKLQRKDE